MQEFIEITKKLNEAKIRPLLIGSLGLEYLSNKDWQAQDIDIQVPGNPGGWEIADRKRIYNWTKILSIMTSLGYEMIDLHEHEFKKEDLHVQFGAVEASLDLQALT